MLKIVVAVCTANRPHYLGQLLDRLCDIDLRGLESYEVSLLIVDNRPGGSTRRQCDESRASLPIPLELVDEPVPGISQARNRAVAVALCINADFLAFLDDDNLPHPDWLAELVARQRATGADVVAGNRRKMTQTDGAPGPIAMMDGEGRLWKANGLPELLSTSTVLIATSVLRRLAATGPVFDPLFSAMGGEDADFFIRARKAGARFAGAPASLIDFRVDGARGTFVGRIARKFKAGCGQGHLARRHLPPAALAGWLVGLAFRTLRDLLAVLPDLIWRRAHSEVASKLGGSIGMWFGLFGGRYHYYTGSGLSE